MLIIPQTVEMKWHPRYRGYYEEKGYKFTSYGGVFDVNVEHLPDGCNKYVGVTCDYCLNDKIYEPYQMYRKRHKEGIIKNDCCYDCKPLKVKESNLIVYGKESTNQVEEIRKKQKKTNIIRYGCQIGMANAEIRKKVERTNLKRYGKKAPAQNEIIKQKILNTNLEKYGQVSPTLDPNVRKKQIASMVKKHGVEFGMQNRDILNKARETLYANGTVPTSRQQIYIRNIIGGELNFPYKNYSLDIAYPEQKIYIECDFGGHWLQVKLRSVSEEEFNKAERKRYYALARNGWQLIKIISINNKVPSQEKVIEMVDFAYDYLSEGHSWIHFDLNKGLVIRSVGEEQYNFGQLFYPYQLGF